MVFQVRLHEGIVLTAFSRNDILRKHGVIPEKPPSPTPLVQEALLEARKQAHENRLEDKDLDELHELEDVEDNAFLRKYRYDVDTIHAPPFVNMVLQEATDGRAIQHYQCQHLQPSLPATEARLLARRHRNFEEVVRSCPPHLLTRQQR